MPSSGPIQTNEISFLSFVISIAVLAKISGPFVGFNLPKNKTNLSSLILCFFLKLFGATFSNKIGSMPFGNIVILSLLVNLDK